MTGNWSIRVLMLAAALLTLGASLAGAELATQAEAERVSGNWVSYLTMQKGDWAGTTTPQVTGMRELYAGDTLLARCFSIAPRGHVLVPVIKALPPVQLYSDESDFDVDETVGITQLMREMLANRLRMFLASYGSLEASQPLPGREALGEKDAEQWKVLLDDPSAFLDRMQRTREPLRDAGPLLTTAWHQNAPYNGLCPQGDGGRCVVGCVATAMAQIMKFHNWPPQGNGSHGYHWGGDQSCGGSSPGQWLQCTYSDAYDWWNMPNSCAGGCTPTQMAAVAELSYEAGVAVDMNYGACASGASSFAVLTAMPAYFRYDNSIRMAYRSSYSAQTWFNLIQAEVDAGRPMYYGFRYDASSGHAIVCDGWRIFEGSNQYHMNYGWGGSYNGWYTIDEIYHTADPMQEQLINNIRPVEGGLAACCIGSSCVLVDITDCTALGGQWFGLVTSCDPNRCETWACCNNGVCSITRGVDCLVGGGEFLQGLDSCDPMPCTLGGCCMGDGTCEVITEYNCTQAGGVWHASVCSENPCVEAACCLGETCQMLLLDDCTLAGGTFLAHVESCDPNPCVPRACCINDLCSLRSYPVCTMMGGTWMADSPECDAYVCLPDSIKLSGGALIVHAPAGLQFSSGTDYCDTYASNPITNSGQQVTRIDPVNPDAAYVWYVLAAWAAPKTWCQTTFGLGSYDPGAMLIENWAPCGGASCQSTANWPGPGEGITLITSQPWNGNFLPMCWAASYVYASGQAPLTEFTLQSQTGFANCEGLSFPIDCYGALGLMVPGVNCYPDARWFACCLGGGCQVLTEEACMAGAGTWLEGTVTCDPDPCSMAVGDEPTPAATFLLAEAAPSPFHGSTRITFEIPGSAASMPARLEIYDASGRLVRTLLDGRVTAGANSATWNGADDQGRGCQAGMYFYRLTAAGQTATKRLLLLR
ncbi:MAG: C10 family peptidase [Candidatus Eisenbacteria bacterium]|nr:C10 family peptidase [Candidatus Eisenbacteria bacterium]